MSKFKLSKLRIKKRQKNNISIFIIALIVFFSEITMDGNQNLLFLLGLLNIFQVYKHRRDVRKNLVFILLLIFSVLLSYLFSPFFEDYTQSIMTIGKLILCFNVLLFIRRKNITYEQLMLGCKYFLRLCLAFTILAFFLRTKLLWLSGFRLKLFFMEPSDMCFYLAVVCFMYGTAFFSRYKRMDLLGLILCFVLSILSASVSGVLYMIMLCAISFIFFKNKKNKAMDIAVYLSAIIICGCIYLLYSDSALFIRILDSLQGRDVSTNFRTLDAYRILPVFLGMTHFVGIGLGNMDLNSTVSFLYLNRVPGKFSNALPYFIAEAGLIGILLVIYCIRRIWKSTSNMNRFYKRLVICIGGFLFLSSCAGNWYTNPGIWLIIGILLSFEKLFISKDQKRSTVI